MIDWVRVSALREEVGPEDFDEVVELFLEEVDSEITGLDSNATPDALGARLHFLKGSALSLGFRKFSDLCQSGEVSISDGSSSVLNVSEIMECYQASRRIFLDELAQKFPA